MSGNDLFGDSLGEGGGRDPGCPPLPARVELDLVRPRLNRLTTTPPPLPLPLPLLSVLSVAFLARNDLEMTDGYLGCQKGDCFISQNHEQDIPN